MANQLITQQIGPVARQSLGILHESIMLPSLMFFDTSTDGDLAEGDTINVRIPAEFVAKVFDEAKGIEIQDIKEGSTPVVLDQILDVSTKLSSKQLTLDLTNFGKQVTNGAMIAIAEGAEKRCAAVMDQATDVIDMVVDDGGALNPAKTLNVMRGALNKRMVPTAGRVTVCGTDFATELRNSDNFLRVDASGSTEALREGFVTRAAGANIYESPYVDAESAWTFVPSAFVFVSRALETMGTSQVSTGSFENVSLRTTMDYDITKKASIVSWDVLTGAKLLSPVRVVRTKLSAVKKK